MTTQARSHPTDQGPMVLVLSGDLDITQRDALSALVAGFARSSCDSVRLDMAQVPFADSTFVLALVALQQIAAERGGTVVVDGAARPVRRLLTLMGIDERVVAA